LASDKEVLLIGSDQQMAADVLEVISSVPDPLRVPFLIEGGRAHPASAAPLTQDGPKQRMNLSALQSTPGVIIYARRDLVHFEHGSPTPTPLQADPPVVTVRYRVGESPGEAGLVLPDVRLHDGGQWWHLGESAAGPGPGGRGVVVPVGQVVTLVCPDNNDHAANRPGDGCGQDQ
jgi:hypothetical protein